MADFDDKTLLVTGGTGSFGRAVIKTLCDYPVKEIRIFSRDEEKQHAMRQAFSDPRIRYHLGDVRDQGSIDLATEGVDYCFHAAALKQVPSCEFFPIQAVYTNIIGSNNVINACKKNQVKSLVCLSTDKAVYPINTMGMTKALMEKLVRSHANNSYPLTITSTRYGNVMASRGSVIPLFISQILSGNPITITNPNMTRFMMTLEQAVDLVLYAFTNGSTGYTYVQKAPAATLATLVESLLYIFDKPSHPTIEIGTRHGEKLYETLCSSEELAGAISTERYFLIPPDKRTLNYDSHISSGDIYDDIESYNSSNTTLLTADQLTPLLYSLPIVREALSQ